MAQPVVIDVISDVVCPWCFLGKRRLDAALASEPDVEVRWRPFQLDPTIPAEGLDRAAYMAAKFPDPARIAAAHERLTALGREAGVDFDFEAIRRAPNTRDAHRLIRFAEETGRQGEIVERLFADYFLRGLDIGARETLIAAAEAAGLDGAETERRLAEGEGIAEVESEIEAARRMGVDGVPFFVFASKFAVSGAQSEDVLARALAEARKAAS